MNEMDFIRFCIFFGCTLLNGKVRPIRFLRWW